MTVRALITIPPVVRPGEVIEIRTLIAHPMESGHRADGQGGVVPRRILRRFTCRLDGHPVFSAELHAAVAANPLIAFPLRVQMSGTLECRWEGDDGFSHTQTAALRVA
jgi:sulfur-oxidizing protein SoxZ